MPATDRKLKVVVFDLGKVLVDFDYAIAIRKLAARGNVSVADFTRFIMTAPLLLEYESGKVSSRQFYEEICDHTGFRGDMDEFAGLFGDIFTPITPMIELQQSLHNRSVPTFVFSNTNDLAIRHIRKVFPFFGCFTGRVLSYEHGSMKPAAPLYEILERTSGFRGPEILYFDDRPENVETGAARGWKAIVHLNPERTIRKVRNLGLLNGARL